MKSIILIGFKSCGKTSIGRMLAKQLQMPFIDTDELIVQRHFRNTGIRLQNADIYRIRGEDYFRDLEKQVVTQIHPQQTRQVIATGGGSIADADNRQHLKQLGLIVYLSLSAERLKARLQELPESAILENYNFETRFMALYTQRLPLYQQLADIELSVDDKSVDAVVAELVSMIEPRFSTVLS